MSRFQTTSAPASAINSSAGPGIVIATSKPIQESYGRASYPGVGVPDCFRADGVLPADKTREQVLAEHLHAAAAKIRPDDDTRTLLRDLERRLGHPLLTPDSTLASADIAAVLVSGARVCFTGDFTDDTGKPWDRAELEYLAEKCGLVPVANVTKTKCEVLIAAEAGTQSGKAKQAVKFAKPIFTAQQFLAWAQSR